MAEADTDAVCTCTHELLDRMLEEAVEPELIDA